MAATALAAVLLVRTREPAHLRSRRARPLRSPRRGVRAGGCRGRRAGIARPRGQRRRLGRRRQGACPRPRAANRPTVVFRSIAHRGAGRDRAARRSPTSRRSPALHCDRVYFAGGRGLCLKRGGGFAAGYRAEVFGPDLEVSHALGVDRHTEPRAGLARRPLRRGDALRHRPRLRRPGAFSTQTTLIDMATGEQDRRPRAVHRVPRQQAGHGRRRQLLGRHLRSRQRPLLRHAGHGRQDLPDRGLGQRAPGARDPRERRVPVAVARRHADRLQEARPARPRRPGT